jgi:hypothetical protein
MVQLLNYKRDGSIFWNLLHMAPVHDGKVRAVVCCAVQRRYGSAILLICVDLTGASVGLSWLPTLTLCFGLFAPTVRSTAGSDCSLHRLSDRHHK